MAYTTTDRFSEKCMPSSIGLDWLQELTTGVNFVLTIVFYWGFGTASMFIPNFAHSSWSIIFDYVVLWSLSIYCGCFLAF